ncbi:GCN5-related N-acetyltransferase [Syntrophobotulus glycolicus DSM 8271]|uniref:GCN5-related N-acetyltransferase n=1 Tax=Syntrophobotulus glycolicus (strain DSM 8271 / FlGlyR) TaxID=645991 RepID=F0SYP5_SYNGF|nr:GNAT family N-acetyltransferase [Syntrophobotulus glycolicus]ADY54846.1 GCN5-related N-acetyltransferase [Syntrophobotulus glycolicus DSM 8271]
MTMTISGLEELLQHEKMEEILGIENDGCKAEIRRLSDSEEIIDYHGRTRRIKMRYKLNPDQRNDRFSFLQGPVFEIMHFCVSPQNFGYGTKFMSHLIKHFQEVGIKSIVLQATNSRAARFWGRLGFLPHPLASDEKLLMYRVSDSDQLLMTNSRPGFSIDAHERNHVMH